MFISKEKWEALESEVQIAQGRAIGARSSAEESKTRLERIEKRIDELEGKIQILEQRTRKEASGLYCTILSDSGRFQELNTADALRLLLDYLDLRIVEGGPHIEQRAMDHKPTEDVS